jgi:hypothetical protein
MILIEEIVVDNTIVSFYNGIDFDILLRHNREGSDGFIYCFIDSWVSEVKSYNRQLKLESIISNAKFSKFEWSKIDNNYISVYQTDGVGIETLYKSIRERVINLRSINNSWLPISGIDKGAWKISGV